MAAKQKKSWIEVAPGAGSGSELRWILHLPDGKVYRSPEGYTTERSAWAGWKRLRKNVIDAQERRKP